jgi:hypothetical protein
MKMRLPALFALVCSAVALSGCYDDPFANPNQWSMNGAPRENLAVQAADPSELITGHGAATSQGVAAAAGVDLAIGGNAGTATGLQKAPPSISFSSSTGS